MAIQHILKMPSHLFLADGAGSVAGGGAGTQGLLYIQVELVQFPHQLVHRLRPWGLDMGRCLWINNKH